jgi:methylglutaconyl-CoA hydratase
VPAMVAAMLRRNMPEKDAFDLLTRGRETNALHLMGFGIVHAELLVEKFDEEVLWLVREYEKLSASAVQMTKRLLYEIDGLTFDEAIELGAQVNARARMTDDCKSGIAKFLEK